MKNSAGKAFVNMLIIIAVLAIIAYIAYTRAISRDGIITKVTTDEETYEKSEVLEEINLLITQKYLEVYSKATAEGQNKLEEFYNPDTVIAYLKGYSGGEDGSINYEEEPDRTVIIEDLASEEGAYYIKIESLKRDITTYGNGENTKYTAKDYFFIRKENESYVLYYKNENMEDERIGDLQFEQKI